MKYILSIIVDFQIQFNSIDFSYPGGSTDTDEALNLVRTSMLTPARGLRVEATQVVLVIVDGKYRQAC